MCILVLPLSAVITILINSSFDLIDCLIDWLIDLKVNGIVFVD